MPLEVQIQLIRQWVYLARHCIKWQLATVIVLPKKTLILLRKYVRVALNISTLSVSLVALCNEC